ncbi:uncharacterized protein LOC133206026 [Saccostrea echinata]|uniref:uncharacterized protein LOC133206026 n=1 Tax=Saccostrea echinata TaxID=191078 RepID=UPI002A7F61E8|nr:uncharacterized protein LOC133206026 [Saccostrea echinata]
MANDNSANDPSSTTTDTPTTTLSSNGGYPHPKGDEERSPTNTVAAVTVAILAVIIVITFVMVARAIRKRRLARRGTRMDQPIPAISTGVMGTPAAAYSNIHISQPTISSSSFVSWEPIETHQHQEHTSRDSFPAENNETQNPSSNVSSTPSQT